MVGEGSWGDVGKGAGTGAAVGTAISPGWGTVIGGGLGALGGWLFGGDDDSSGGGAWTPEGYGWMSPTKGQEGKSDIWGPPEMYMQYGQGMREPVRQPVQTARGLGGEAYGEERSALGMLRRRATGEDSVARQAGERQLDAAKRAIVAAARSGRQTPAAARNAIMQTSTAGQQIAGKIAEAESQERLAAEKAYMSAASGMRGEALAQQKTEQEWWRTKADWERVKGDMLAKYMAMGLQEKEAERRARMDYQTLLAGLHNKMMQHQDTMSAREREAWLGLISSGMQAIAPLAAAAAGSGGGGGGGGATTSDVRAKKNIRVYSDEACKANINPMRMEKYAPQGMSPDEEVEGLLDNIAAYEFDYKPGFGPPGRQVGVMAQDLEQSQLGASMVGQNPEDGMKNVNYSPEKFNPIAMASLANLNERVRGLESEMGNAPLGAQSTGELRNTMVGAGSMYDRGVPQAPQQGVLGEQNKPDIGAFKAMLSQMGR